MSESEKLKQVEQAIVGLVNFEGMVMDYCLQCAEKLTADRMGKSSIVHGPDTGPSPGENPMTGAIAIHIYDQVRRSLREGPNAKQPQKDS
jgi:hypothetical protein